MGVNGSFLVIGFVYFILLCMLTLEMVVLSLLVIGCINKSNVQLFVMTTSSLSNFIYHVWCCALCLVQALAEVLLQHDSHENTYAAFGN